MRCLPLLCLAGCHRLLELGTVELDDGGARDAEVFDTADASEDPRCVYDHFTGSTMKPMWRRVEEASLISVKQSDNLRIDLTMNVNGAQQGEEGYRLVDARDMNGYNVSVEVPQIVSSTTYRVENYLEVYIDRDNRFMMGSSKQLLWPARGVAGSFQSINETPYEPTEHRFWRLSFAASTVTYEVSPDRTTWMQIGQLQTPLAVSSMRVGLIAGSYSSGDATPGVAIFDNLAICPNAI
jgi:hypothetical protein